MIPILKRLVERLSGRSCWPADPKERVRMRALMLGAGAGPAMRPDKDGVVRVEVEDADEAKVCGK